MGAPSLDVRERLFLCQGLPGLLELRSAGSGSVARFRLWRSLLCFVTAVVVADVSLVGLVLLFVEPSPRVPLLLVPLPFMYLLWGTVLYRFRLEAHQRGEAIRLWSSQISEAAAYYGVSSSWVAKQVYRRVRPVE